MTNFYIKNYKLVHHLQMLITMLIMFQFTSISLVSNPGILLLVVLLNIPASILLIKLAGIEEYVKNLENKKRGN